jgi:hypothetical protein
MDTKQQHSAGASRRRRNPTRDFFLPVEPDFDDVAKPLSPEEAAAAAAEREAAVRAERTAAYNHAARKAAYGSDRHTKQVKNMLNLGRAWYTRHEY